ncbi:MAG: protein BatD [Alistipes sp.]|nr:protein BatD [Alistipes sp.]MBO7264062.1 protein BatD [Alistipes sp.]
MTRGIQRFLVVLVALLSTLTVWGQVSFKVDAPALTALGEPFRVEFSVDAEPERNSFKAPDFEGFDVLAGPSVSTGHSVQFVNGRKSASYSCTYTYVLMPSEAGKFTIGTASITVEDKKYTTKPQLIEVIAEKVSERPAEQGSGDTKQKSSPESRIAKDDILLRLKLSDRDVYKGEAIRVSLVLYTRVNISDVSDVNIPSFDGFWSQELSFDNVPSREEYNGRIYETHKITEMLLSPQQSGRITIPSASMTVRTPVEVQGNRHFDPFFGGRQIHYVTKQLKSEPITIDVREFPQGAPRSFKGAVGDFRISYRMPSSEIESNSADQFELTISGSGNLKFITAPRLSLPDSFELYDTKIVDNIKVTASGTTGSITYTYPFVARSAGEFAIMPIEFCYFDPQTKEYKTLTTEPFTITIKDDGSTVAKHSADNYVNYGSTMRQLDKDIRFIHIGALPPKSASVLIFSPIYWLVVVVLLAIFVVVYVVMRKRIRDNRNIVARRMKRADKVAIQRLRMAERSMNEGNRHAFYEETLRAMWGYISDKFNIPVASLTKEKIREELYRRGVAMAVAEEFCEIISRSEEAQYAPSTEGEMSVVYADAIDVMSKIEEVVKR